MRFASVSIAALAQGCFFGHVFHLDANAPGEIDVSDPPPDTLGIGKRVRPQDPGERMVIVTAGASFGAGSWEGDFTLSLTPEVAGYYGERAWGHLSDDVLSGDHRVHPEWLVGGSIGYDVAPLGQADRRLVSTFRLCEELTGLELGHAFEPAAGVHSGLAGLWFASDVRFLWLRALWGPERGFGFEAGIAIDWAFTWVWSR